MKVSARIKFIFNNLIAVIVVIIAIGALVLYQLEDYTRHGESIAVPSFEGMTPEEASAVAQHNHLKISIIDSLYNEAAKPGTILEQYPASGAHVKEKRLIHLTINAQSPEKVTLPNLKNSAYRQTLQTLAARGFKVGHIEYAPSEFKNLVLNLHHKGMDVEAGTLLPKGSTIDIVLGQGLGSNTITVPRLLGKRLPEALAVAQQSYLNIGEIIPDGSIPDKNNLSSGIIYQQTPGPTAIVDGGTPITLYVTLQKAKINSIDSLIITE